MEIGEHNSQGPESVSGQIFICMWDTERNKNKKAC